MRVLQLAVIVGIFSAAGLASAAGYQGPTRIDFDERLVKGQTAKAGSVYIFKRREADVYSLVKRKRRFRPKIIRTVFED